MNKFSRIAILSSAVVLLTTLAFAGSQQKWGEGDTYRQLKNAFSADGSVGHQHDGTDSAEIITPGDLTFRTSLLAIGRVGASSTLASSSTTLLPATLPYCVLVKAVGGAGTNPDASPGTTLQNGIPGQTITLVVQSLKTGGTWVVTPLKACGWKTITFDTKGDFATLIYVNDTVGWRVTAQSGCTLTQDTDNWQP